MHLLLKKGVDANAENEDGKKPTDLAKHDGLKKAILGNNIVYININILINTRLLGK